MSSPNFTVPKFASGKTPLLDDGASAIHSAEDSDATETVVGELVQEVDLVVSVIETVNALLPCAR